MSIEGGMVGQGSVSTGIVTEPPAQRAPLPAALDPVLASCLWGGMYVVSRASFGAIPPVTLAALRVVIGGLTLAPALFFLPARRAGFPGAPVWRRGGQPRALGRGPGGARRVPLPVPSAGPARA